MDIKQEPTDETPMNIDEEFMCYDDNDQLLNTSEIFKLDYNSSRKFVAIEYPGIVQNVDKMIDTLGGLQTISEIISSEAPRRMELNFRPSDVYSKPACGDKYPTLGLVLKIRIKRRKKKVNAATSSRDTNEDENSVSSVEVLGICEEIYKFDNFADFQYLPIHREENGEVKNIYDDLIPDGLVNLSWLDKPNTVPFFPPSSFSRIDTTEGYKYSISKKDVSSERHIIGRTRVPRSGFTKLCSFYDNVIPEKPFKGAFNSLRVKMCGEQELNALKKLFETRPIWSRVAILANTKFTLDQLKHVLPTVAYYFINGPWRVMWVKYGYDPRKDPASRIYQTLDFRVKANLPTLKTKRFNSVSLKSISFPKKRTVLLSNAISVNRKVKSTQRSYNYIFKPGLLPESRQMFYQFCDLHVPEIQAMLARLPEIGPDVQCNERTGWLPAGFDERCREILNELILDTVTSSKKQKSTQNRNVSDNDDDGDEDYVDDDDEEEWDDELEEIGDSD